MTVAALLSLGAPQQAAFALAAARDEMEVAALMRKLARAMTSADGVTIVFKAGDRVAYVDEDAIGPLWKGRDFPIETCISGWAIRHRQTVAIEDIFADERIPHEAYKPTFVKSMMMAPVHPPKPYAAIGAYWARPHRASMFELSRLEAAAAIAAVALRRLTTGPASQAA
ncbi:GAF domain-containing protein [Terricaulis sp.]|uniref:GAF domain-containing protein n=1 Tax=Terricaulis sp. TaxID=2768686 RepID=UPI003782FF7B